MALPPSTASTHPASGPWPSRDAILGDPSKSSFLYRAIVRWGAFLVRHHYRVEVRGEEFPDDAPVLLVQNHTNGLCDAHFLMSSNVRPIRILVKYKLMTVPVIGWMLRRMQAVPMYRKKDGVDTRKNASSFEAIDAALVHDRSVIALFPEGESLNSIGLREMRSGVGRMAISAFEAGADELRVVPVGVTYERRDRYRTLASALIGESIRVGDVVEEFGADGQRAKVNALMKRARTGLESLILHAESQVEHDAALAFERIAASDDRPLGIRRKEALSHVRGESAERQQAIIQLGERLEAHRLTGDDVLGPSPDAATVVRGLVIDLPWLLINLVAWAVPIAVSVSISRLRRSPDKLVTLRVLFANAGFLIWTPALMALGALAYGWAGALAAFLFVAISLATFAGTVDRVLDLKRALALRSIERNPDERDGLRSALRLIRG